MSEQVTKQYLDKNRERILNSFKRNPYAIFGQKGFRYCISRPRVSFPKGKKIIKYGLKDKEKNWKIIHWVYRFIDNEDESKEEFHCDCKKKERCDEFWGTLMILDFLPVESVPKIQVTKWFPIMEYGYGRWVFKRSKLVLETKDEYYNKATYALEHVEHLIHAMGEFKRFSPKLLKKELTRKQIGHAKAIKIYDFKDRFWKLIRQN